MYLQYRKDEINPEIERECVLANSRLQTYSEMADLCSELRSGNPGRIPGTFLKQSAPLCFFICRWKDFTRAEYVTQCPAAGRTPRAPSMRPSRLRGKLRLGSGGRG